MILPGCCAPVHESQDQQKHDRRIDSEESKSAPRRIRRVSPGMVDLLGVSAGCVKCRVMASGDQGYDAMRHSAKCRDASRAS